MHIYIERERRIRFLLEERTEIEDPSYVDRFLHYSGIPVYSLACIGNPIPPPPPPLYFYLPTTFSYHISPQIFEIILTLIETILNLCLKKRK